MATKSSTMNNSYNNLRWRGSRSQNQGFCFWHPPGGLFIRDGRLHWCSFGGFFWFRRLMVSSSSSHTLILKCSSVLLSKAIVQHPLFVLRMYSWQGNAPLCYQVRWYCTLSISSSLPAIRQDTNHAKQMSYGNACTAGLVKTFDSAIC